MHCKAETERIVKFLKDTNKEAGTKGYVLGVSGGLDSAVVYKLCKLALGKSGVRTVYIPDVEDVADTIYDNINSLVYGGVDSEPDIVETLCIFPLERFLNALILIDSVDEDIINDALSVGNFKARLRMAILYGFANTRKRLVCGTTSKSEYMIGYFTKYGDGASDVEPIQHLYKTEVYELAKYLKVPQSIIDAKPSAGLWEGQTDYDEIGLTYATVDTILKALEPRAIQKWHLEYTTVVEDISNKVRRNKSAVEKVINMVLQSEHKRCMPRSLG